jgi:hypothetical protein
MPTLNERLKVGGIIAAVVVAGLGMSYCSAAPNYAFQKKTLAEMPPGFGLINTVKTADITSPVTWLKGTVGTYVFAKPEPPNADIFTVAVVPYEERPSVYMVQVDCEAKEVIRAFPDDQGEPLLNIWGEPFTTQEGKVFRSGDVKAASPDDLADFCQRDWSKERAALPRRGRPKDPL